MARPRKKGLDYFPLDADFFEDEKFFDVQTEYGCMGEAVYVRLLCLIYKNGYYYRFGSLERLAGILMRSIGERWINDKETIVSIIHLLAECGLFSKELMQENILTSRGIQRRYMEVASRRRSKMDKYCLLEEDEIREAGDCTSGHEAQEEKAKCTAEEAEADREEARAVAYEAGVIAADCGVSATKSVQSKVNSKTKEKEKQSSVYTGAEYNQAPVHEHDTHDTSQRVLYRIPMRNGSYELKESFYGELAGRFPNTNIDASLEKLLAYLESNPKKRRYSREQTEGYMLMWLNDDESRNIPKTPADEGAAYDLDEYSTMDPFA